MICELQAVKCLCFDFWWAYVNIFVIILELRFLATWGQQKKICKHNTDILPPDEVHTANL